MIEKIVLNSYLECISIYIYIYMCVCVCVCVCVHMCIYISIYTIEAQVCADEPQVSSDEFSLGG